MEYKTAYDIYRRDVEYAVPKLSRPLESVS